MKSNWLLVEIAINLQDVIMTTQVERKERLDKCEATQKALTGKLLM